MYKNIVFDLGGVVVDYKPKDYLVDRFFHEKTEQKIYDAVFGSNEWLMLDRGDISWEQACKIFMGRAKQKDIEFEMEVVLEEWTDMLETRKPTITLMRLLKKKGFNLYYLSNISSHAFEVVSKRDFWNLFDGGIASCEVNINKPDPEIYRMLLSKYKLVPQETIFTDDNRENAANAFQAGITGILFENVKSFCSMLVTYGIDIS